MVEIYVTLTAVGSDQGTLFDLYSDTDGFSNAFEVGVAQTALESGYTTQNAPEGITIVRVCGQNSLCSNCIDLELNYTTTTSTTTSTTTQVPETTTTTTTNNTTGISAVFISTFFEPIDGCAIPENDVDNSIFIDLQTSNVPSVGDILYNDINGLSPFQGNGSFYKITLDENIYYSVRVNSQGEIQTGISICI